MGHRNIPQKGDTSANLNGFIPAPFQLVRLGFPVSAFPGPGVMAKGLQVERMIVESGI